MLLEKKARSWRAQYLRQTMLDGALLLSGGTLLALACALRLDRAASLPRSARTAILAAGAAALTALAYLRVLRPWLGLRWGRVLDDAGLRFPALSRHLRSAWDLRDAPAPHTSEALQEAHLAQTETLLADLPDLPVYPFRPSRAGRRGAWAALLGAAALAGFHGDAAWQRVLAPWRDVPFESLAEVLPGDKTVEWGKTVPIEVRWKAGGAAPRGLTLTLKGRDGAWQSRAWDKSAPEGFSYSVEELTEPLAYRVRLGELSSREYRLVPAPPPQFLALRARIHSIAGVSEVALSAAEPVSILRGGWLSVEGVPNQPLAKAFLKVSSLPVPVAMKPSKEGGYEAGFTVTEDASLQFDLETPDGRRDSAPPVFQLRAAADQPPTIELLSPLMPLQASPADSIPITYQARDDIGLSRISLLVRPPGAPEKELVLKQFPRSEKEFLGDHLWELAGLPLGVKVEFQLKALDNASPPQLGLSEKGSVELVDFASAHADMERRWLSAQKDLESLARREEEARDLAAAGKASELAARAAELPEAWKKAAEDYSELAKSMEKDVYANPGLSDQAKTLSRELDDARSESLPEALEAGKKGDLPAAAKAHDELARSLRKTEKLMKEGAKLQGLQDLYTEASRMSQAGSELQSSLEAMTAKNAPKPSQEDVEKLQAALSRLQERMDALRKTIESIPKPPPGAGEKARRSYTLPLEAARNVSDLLQKALADGDYAFAAKMAQALAENLGKIEKALSDAAMHEASASEGQSPASERLEKAQALWQEAAEDQAKDLEKTQQIEQRKLKEMMAEQKELLAKLAARQTAVVSAATAPGAEPAPDDALAAMRAAQGEFETRKVQNAASELKAAAARLRLEPLRRGKADPRFEELASAEDAIREELESAPQSPSEDEPDAETAAAAQGQARTRGKTAALQKELQAIRDETGALPRKTVDRVGEAQGEQQAAEESLGQGDSASALRHQEKAQSLLDQAGKESSQAMQDQKGIESGMGAGFEKPGGGVRQSAGPGANGSRLGAVPLPTAKDFRPPQEIREELERSLKESRPAAYDRAVKEYFKRIAQ